MRLAALLLLPFFVNGGAAEQAPLTSECPNPYRSADGSIDLSRFAPDLEEGKVRDAGCMSLTEKNRILGAWGELLLAYRQPRPSQFYLDFLAIASDVLAADALALNTPYCKENLLGLTMTAEALSVGHGMPFKFSDEDAACLLSYEREALLARQVLSVLRRARATSAVSGSEPQYRLAVPALSDATRIYAEIQMDRLRNPDSEWYFLAEILPTLRVAPELVASFGWALQRANAARPKVESGNNALGASLRFASYCFLSPVTRQGLNPKGEKPDCADEAKANRAIEHLLPTMKIVHALAIVDRNGDGAWFEDEFAYLFGYDVWKYVADSPGRGRVSQRRSVLTLTYMGLALKEMGKWGRAGPFDWDLMMMNWSYHEAGAYGVLLDDPTDCLDSLDLTITMADHITAWRNDPAFRRPPSSPMFVLAAADISVQANEQKRFLTTFRPRTVVP